MDNDLFRKIKMFVLVVAYLKLNLTIWTSSAAITAEVAALEAGIDKINEYDRVEKNSISASKGKVQKKKKMIAAAIKVCKAGLAYASSIKDDALKVKFDYSASDLAKGNEGESYTRCIDIGAYALPIKAQFILKGMAADQLTILSDACEAYNLTITQPKGVIAAHKIANEKMREKFDEMDELLKERLDGLIYSFVESEPDFYAGYEGSRYIGGRSHKAIIPPVPPVVPVTLVVPPPIEDTNPPMA